MLFSYITTTVNQPDVTFNCNALQSNANQEHLWLILDEKLTFNDDITSKLSRVNKNLRKPFHYVPCDSLVTIYKSFIRPHLEYVGVIFDKPNNATFCNWIKSAQYNAILAITGTITSRSTEKLYQELWFKRMQSRKWFRRLCCFIKIWNNQPPGYLLSLNPRPNSHNTKRNYSKLRPIFCRISVV